MEVNRIVSLKENQSIVVEKFFISIWDIAHSAITFLLVELLGAPDYDIHSFLSKYQKIILHFNYTTVWRSPSRLID